MKKPSLAVLLGTKPKEDDEEEDPKSSEGGDTLDLAQELMDAIKSGDAQGVADAFKALCMACEGDE